jgi:thiosulfate dehydrogenase [quinone] large subunit
MFVAFFESVKYVGHLLPISFLRVFLGYYYLNQALIQFKGDFLLRPRLAAQVSEALPSLQVPVWYRMFLENIVIPQWQIFAFLILGIQFAIAVSYLFGYVVRPVALMGMALCFYLLIISGPQYEDLYKTFIAIHFMMAWVGAGRCLGFDYYFFKRRRGIWW